MLFSLLLAAALQSAGPVDHAQHATPIKAKPERKICKRNDTTESRMGSKRICKTAAEWRGERNDGAIDDAAQVTSAKTR